MLLLVIYCYKCKVVKANQGNTDPYTAPDVPTNMKKYKSDQFENVRLMFANLPLNVRSTSNCTVGEHVRDLIYRTGIVLHLSYFFLSFLSYYFYNY